MRGSARAVVVTRDAGTGLVPDAPAGIAPAGIAPAGIVPAGIAPAGGAPVGIAPVGIVPVERRLTGRAIQAWKAAGRLAVPGFDAVSLFVRDPAGRAVVARAGTEITAHFGLFPGMTLDSRGLAAEARAACDLIALRPEPVEFETTLAARGRACILLRGVALPLGPDITLVQVIVGWREVLNRGATARLRRELAAALLAVRGPARARGPVHPSGAPDPFGAPLLN